MHNLFNGLKCNRLVPKAIYLIEINKIKKKKTFSSKNEKPLYCTVRASKS